MEARILRLSEMLYADARGTVRVPVQSLFAGLAPEETEHLEETLGLFERCRLISLSVDRRDIILNSFGKRAHEDGSSPALCLGFPYLCGLLRSSVVAIEVIGTGGDPAMGSGFFSAEFPGKVVTAAHVARCEIRNISTSNWQNIAVVNPEVRFCRHEAIDLALISCDMPAESKALPTEWDLRNVDELDAVIVAGYPYIANHERTFVPSEGTLTTIGKKRGGEFDSLLISRITTPGFSGGPVVSKNGRVIGVVEQENTDVTIGQRDGVFISATPATYLREMD